MGTRYYCVRLRRLLMMGCRLSCYHFMQFW
nr:MAG TPA: hypothetical protein [Caudoviricetes sp.]DAM70388.1 MAG TPA: hypothetical protein [Caudoviricetes sp.]